VAGKAPAQGLGRVLVLAAKRLYVRGVARLALVPDKIAFVNFLLAGAALFHFRNEAITLLIIVCLKNCTRAGLQNG
jgi:hypothetical protein